MKIKFVKLTIMRRGLRLTAPLLLAMMTACAGQQYSHQVCTELDMAALGAEDGAQGIASNTDLLIAKCADLGVAVDKSEYSSAHRAAATEFCQTAQAYDRGLIDGRYENICDIAFTEDYQLGKSIFDALHRIWKLEKEIEQFERHIHLINLSDADDGYQTKIRKNRALITVERAKLIGLRRIAEQRGLSS